MSALGQKQTSNWRPLMSAIHPKADMTTGPAYIQRTSFGSLATLAAIRRASSRLPWIAPKPRQAHRHAQFVLPFDAERSTGSYDAADLFAHDRRASIDPQQIAKNRTINAT